MTADDRPKRSLADDPEFCASLAGLDQGMGGETLPPDRAADESLPDRDRGLDAGAPPAGLAGRPPAAAISRSAARTVPPPAAPSMSYPASTGGRRPLLDLFPSPGRQPGPPSAPAVLPLGPPPTRAPSPLCDRTLEEGFNVSTSVLDGQLVKAAAEDLELSVPSSRSSWARKAAIAAGLLVLILIGAAAAAFVFRSDLSALLREWRNTPSFPSRPQSGAPAPIGPVPSSR